MLMSGCHESGFDFEEDVSRLADHHDRARRPWLSPQLIYEALVDGPVITPSCKSMARWSFTAQRSTTRWSLTL